MKCVHGCGQEALFQTKSGKHICAKHTNSCPVIRSKNSIGMQKAYASGERKPAKEVHANLTKEAKDRMTWNKGNRYADFSYNGKGQHKNALLSERGHKCECCELEAWLDKPITLELEHVDADRKNNTRENLKLLCPNCHSQTLTWRRGSGHAGWKRKKYTDIQMVEAITTSTCLNSALEKLDLRYGSAKTLIDVMGKYQINFMGG